MNEFKVKCISGSGGTFTVGETYSVKDGMVSSDIDSSFGIGDFNCLDDINEYGPFIGCGIKCEKVEESKMVTKDEIRSGDKIITEFGKGIVVEFNGKRVIRYDDDTDGHDVVGTISPDRIKTVIRPADDYQLRVDEFSGGTVVLDRKAGIGCEPPIKEITVSEAEKALTEKFGENVKIVVGK